MFTVSIRLLGWDAQTGLSALDTRRRFGLGDSAHFRLSTDSRHHATSAPATEALARDCFPPTVTDVERYVRLEDLRAGDLVAVEPGHAWEYTHRAVRLADLSPARVHELWEAVGRREAAAAAAAAATRLAELEAQLSAYRALISELRDELSALRDESEAEEEAVM